MLGLAGRLPARATSMKPWSRHGTIAQGIDHGVGDVVADDGGEDAGVDGVRPQRAKGRVKSRGFSAMPAVVNSGCHG